MKFVFGLMLLLSACYAQAYSYTKEFSEAELQNMVSAMMPLSRTKYFVTLTFTQPKVHLLETTNELGLGANIHASALGAFNGNGTTYITGSISYNQEEGAFYFQNPRLVELKLKGVAKKQQTEIQKLAQSTITTLLASRPIYILNDNDLKQKLAKSTLESVTVAKGKLVVSLSVF